MEKEEANGMPQGKRNASCFGEAKLLKRVGHEGKAIKPGERPRRSGLDRRRGPHMVLGSRLYPVGRG